MKKIPFVTLALLGAALSTPSFAGDRQWSFDKATHSGLAIFGGEVTAAPGVRKQSLAFNGAAVLQVKDSSAATHHKSGFTCAVWVNPYAVNGGQQMIVAKNRYSLNEREWGVMIDKNGRYTLYVRQGGWSTLASDVLPTVGKWQQVAVAISDEAARLWINGRSAGSLTLARPLPKTKAPLTFGGVNDNGRIWQNLLGALDEAALFERALSDGEITRLYEQHRVAAAAAEAHTPPKVEVFPLWSGGPIPANAEDIPFAEGIEHQTLLDARQHDYKFLHGAAIIDFKGTMFANWANSPTNENQQFETLQGRRSLDGGRTWGEVEMVGPGFEGVERHSHGVFMKHQGRLWAFCARFGKGTPGRRFPGLCAEAFVLNEQTDKWDSKGIVMTNCWPYDEPVRMANGNFITGGQDKDGLPVVAISHGDDVMKWDSVLIPYDRALRPSFAETTVWSEGDRVIAVIRGGGGVAWVSTSDDFGRTWSKAGRSNLPMPRAKAYLGKLSTGQWYLISNFKNRDTLVVSVGRPGENSLSSMWRIRHGRSIPPRFPGFAKGKQWSYPYGYEHDGRLHVVYSVGKEDCGLTTIPVKALMPKPPVPLWDGPALPNIAEAEVLKGVRFHVIKKWEPKVDGYQWLHGVGLAWHKGKLYASYGHNVGRENTITEEGRYSVSEDGGASWSKPKTIDVGTESDDLAVSHGVFLSYQRKLWSFLGAFHGSRKRVHTRAYILDEATGRWTPKGVVIGNGFWPMQEPVKMDDGNWILPGFIVGRGNPAAVAISEGDDLTKWNLIVIPKEPHLGNMWGESSIVVDGPRILNIARYGAKPLALAATSEDFGRTWTATRESDLPMAGSKPASGMLSTGQRYLVCSTTADGGHRRYPLTIAVSRPGETEFSKIFVIRHAEFPAGPGESHPKAALSYPYTIEHDGKLYIGYSNAGGRGGNHNSAELAVVPVASLRLP